MKEFKELNLKHELLEALNAMNFRNTTEVQELAIPVVLEHKDLVVRSKTGSGKTGAFLVPIFQMLEHRGHPQALVIVPTRELAVQVNTVAQKLGSRGHIRSLVVYGGASINVQIQGLRMGADVVIGTPGRLLDLMDRGALRLDKIKVFVLDEADLMLDMGFIDDISTIMSMAPHDKQTLLFSATMPRQIVDIAKRHMKQDATRITVGEEDEVTVSTISHYYVMANGKMKFASLLAYVDKYNPRKCIIFTSTQRESEYVHRFLAGRGLDAIVMHGGLSQAQRERSLHAFKVHAKFLISTNLVSRGLDIPDITDIINFDAPNEPNVYVHRVGRSARMGKDGRAFTMFSFDQKRLMEDTQAVANVRMEHLNLDTSKYKDIELPFNDRGRGGGGFRRDRGGGRDFHSRRLEFHPSGGGQHHNRNSHYRNRRY